jgi:hypothetical protein
MIQLISDMPNFSLFSFDVFFASREGRLISGRERMSAICRFSDIGSKDGSNHYLNEF